jgi:hypothetical protein
MASHIQLKATQAGLSYVPETMSNSASGSHECPINLDLIADCFTYESSSSYCFLSDDTAMRSLMLTHGLHVDNLDRTECECSLCYHILCGLCANLPADNNLKRSACDDISGSCLSARQLELVIMDMFIDKLAPKMSLKLFQCLCASIDIAEYTFLPRHELICRLQTRCHSLQNMVSNPSPLAILRDFDHMRKLTLLNVVVGHGLVVDSKWTIEDLCNAIVRHPTRADCITHSQATQPEHCQSVRDQFPESSADSSIELQCQILESMTDKLIASLLRRILQIHEIPFEKENSVSQLRRGLLKYVCTLRKGKFPPSKNQTEVD